MASANGITREFLDRILEVSFFKTVLNGTVDQFGQGRCQIKIQPRHEHRQFLGAVHGGIVGALADDACAWACASIAGELVTASYAINLLAAATGDVLVAKGQLLKAGRRIVVGRADVFSIQGSTEKLVAAFQATLSPVVSPA